MNAGRAGVVWVVYDLRMASLTAKKIGGRTYYYLRETRRVDGRPKVVRTVYLGTAEAVAAKLAGEGPAPGKPREATVRSFGAVAALHEMARRIDLVGTVDRRVPKRKRRGLSVGTYLLLAAINRAVKPTSKAALAGWFERTALGRLIAARRSQLTSQRFWDNMGRVSEEDIVAIERELSERCVREFGLDLSCLFYDATNFFTFLDSFNDRSKLAQRGHSKEGRASLRVLGLALLVTRDFQVPLFHKLYPGNQPDAPTFRSVTDELVARYRLLCDQAESVTLVFDKGNNAEDTVAAVADGPYHVVGSLVPTQHEDLLAIPLSRLTPLDSTMLPGVRACRVEKEVFGRRFTVLVTRNEKLLTAQKKTLEREVKRRLLRLEKVRASLARWKAGKGRGRAPTMSSVRKRVSKIVTGRHMPELVHVALEKDPDTGLPTLRARFDRRAYRRLEARLLGKTILFTDQAAWKDEDIVLAYRGQHHVEAAFRQMKDVQHVSFRPSFHWTDQKLRVHAFYCVLALLLCSLLRRELAGSGIRLSTRAMLSALAAIGEVDVLVPSDGGRPRTQRTLTTRSPLQQRLLDALNLEQLAPT